MPKFGTSVGENIESKNLGLTALVVVSRFAAHSSGADVSKLISEIKVPSNVEIGASRRRSIRALNNVDEQRQTLDTLDVGSPFGSYVDELLGGLSALADAVSCPADTITPETAPEDPSRRARI